jgi:hypothetical protein
MHFLPALSYAQVRNGKERTQGETSGSHCINRLSCEEAQLSSGGQNRVPARCSYAPRRGILERE